MRLDKVCTATKRCTVRRLTHSISLAALIDTYDIGSCDREGNLHHTAAALYGPAVLYMNHGLTLSRNYELQVLETRRCGRVYIEFLQPM